MRTAEQRAAHEAPNLRRAVRASAVTGWCALHAGDRTAAQRHAAQARATFTAQPGVSPYDKAPLVKLERALGVRPAPV